MLPKKLIVDANILFSFFKKDSSRRQIFEELLNNSCKMLSPYFVLEELGNEREKIMKFSHITFGGFEFTLSTLEDEIELISEEEYKKFLAKAKKIIHKKDAPYFALALSSNLPIWSDEKNFKKQSLIEIFSTAELYKELFNI